MVPNFHRVVVVSVLFLAAACEQAPGRDSCGNDSCDELSLSAEAELTQSVDRDILPFLLGGDFGEFTGVEGVPIRYVVLAPAGESRGALVILNGRSESFAKYAELAWDLRASGYTIYMMDHRGQGFSGRMLADPIKGYVESFDDYVADLATFVDTVVGDAHPRRVAFAHSMGGAVLALFLQHHPGVFDAAVFNAPMWQIDLGALNLIDALSLDELAAKAILKFRDPEDYIASDGAMGGEAAGPFEGNKLTTSRTRFELSRRLMTKEFAPGRSPTKKWDLLAPLAIAGGTNAWLSAAIDAGRELRKNADELTLPMLVFSPRDDEIVIADAHRDVCEDAANCVLVELDERHEAYLGSDGSRNTTLLPATLRFLAQVP